ncbi:MAG: hypothetical protein IPI81_17900, partial [Flavobacteriales bacterium]|nr:hypothetical protein [Flavobacteriales bacterium]
MPGLVGPLSKQTNGLVRAWRLIHASQGTILLIDHNLIDVRTGSVVAGIVGVKKFQYDIRGDTGACAKALRRRRVNTASRMESSGEVGQVNISEATYQLVVGDQLSVVGRADGQRTTGNRQQFHFTPRGKV